MARCWQVEFAHCLKVYRGHQTIVNCIVVQEDIGKKANPLFMLHSET